MTKIILGAFFADAVTEAAEQRVVTMAQVGRVDETCAALFDAVGLSLTMRGAKGASPKGAAARYAMLITGDKPAGKPAKGIAKDWSDVAQSLRALNEILHKAGAVDAPASLPAWADPVALARDKAAKAEARKQAKAAKADAENAEAAQEEGAAITAAAIVVDAAPSESDNVDAAILTLMSADAEAFDADQRAAIIALAAKFAQVAETV